MKYTRGKDGLFHKYITVDGKRRHISSKDEKEFEKLVAEAEYFKSRGVVLANSLTTFKTVGNEWFRLKQTNNAYPTKKRNQGLLDNYIYPAIGHLPIKNIKQYHIQDLINRLVKENKTDTIRKVKQLINAIMNFAVDNDIIMKNVAKTVSTPTFMKTEKKALTAQEMQILESSTNKYTDFFALLLYTGMRRGEIVALTWDDVDFKNNVIHINKSATFIQNQAVKKATKNNKPRTIPMLSKTREILESRYNNKESKYVFYKQDKGMLSECSIKRMLESFKKDTGLDFGLHQLRHTFCTILYNAGVPLKETQSIMGHSSASVTLNIYTHLDQSKTEESISKIEGYLNQTAQ